MATEFTYNIADDTLNGEVSERSLDTSIRDSAIVTALDRVDTTDTEITVVFKAALSSGDETVLNGIIAAHDGVWTPTASPVEIQNDSNSPVKTFALAEGSGLRARLIGMHNGVNVPKNQANTLDWVIPQTSYVGVNKQSYMDGIQYKAKDGVEGDKLTFQVVDKDNLLGYGAGFVLDEFGKDWPVVPDEKDVIRLYKAKLLPGFYIRMIYTSVGTVNDVTLSVGLFRHMDTSEDL